MSSYYLDREQTAAKHHILRAYLQRLAFKVLLGGRPSLAYIDGFSGPWNSRAPDKSDTSFMIAINVLKDVQRELREKGQVKEIRLFFVENDPEAFADLKATVEPHHDPANGFVVETRQGRFQDAIPQIAKFINGAFPLIFIDPTGWTGYPFDAIRSLLRRRPSEVLINFMYDHINRFAASPDPKTIASLGEILGGPDWVKNLDASLPRSLAVEQLFRDVLSREGQYDAVLSTPIQKSVMDRPHFFIVYGTRHPEGVRTFRDVEYKALKEHEKLRQDAKNRKREDKTGMSDLFGGPPVPQDGTIDSIVERDREVAESIAPSLLAHGPLKFERFAVILMEALMLRETDLKDLCVKLAKAGVINDTWSVENKRKPHGHHMVGLKAAKQR